MRQLKFDRFPAVGETTGVAIHKLHVPTNAWRIPHRVRCIEGIVLAFRFTQHDICVELGKRKTKAFGADDLNAVDPSPLVNPARESD